jgi:hypothetical protein
MRELGPWPGTKEPSFFRLQLELNHKSENNCLKRGSGKLVAVLTVPLSVGSAMGDRFPWKSGQTWRSPVKNASLSRFASLAIAFKRLLK